MTRKKVAFLGQYPRHVVKAVLGQDFESSLDEVSFQDADYLFFSESDPDHHAAARNTVKIFITGENACPDFNTADYAMSSEYLDYRDRHLRFPYYASNDAAKGLNSRPKLALEDLEKKTRFCNFIYSNHKLADPTRDTFFHELNAVVPVSSAGRHLRNDDALAEDSNPDWASAKRGFMSTFRFTIAFENSAHPGYTTEKITDALIARTVPIYWGDPWVCEEINPAAFIHLRNFPGNRDAIAFIEGLENSSSQLLEILNAIPFCDGKDLVEHHRYAARRFLENIFNEPKEKARRRPKYGRALMLERKRRSDQTGWKRKLHRNRF